jgi:hypothetical protein
MFSACSAGVSAVLDHLHIGCGARYSSLIVIDVQYSLRVAEQNLVRGCSLHLGTMQIMHGLPNLLNNTKYKRKK